MPKRRVEGVVVEEAPKEAPVADAPGEQETKKRRIHELQAIAQAAADAVATARNESSADEAPPPAKPMHACTHVGCTKMFSTVSNLATHMRSHTGERKFRCDVDGCDKAFARSGLSSCFVVVAFLPS
jgi:hypothetical protein